MSQKKITGGTVYMIDPKYRLFTEDEIKELKRGTHNWSNRMKEESNFLYKLKYSLGTITRPFIEGVIESLESSGDFEITSFGYSKFILFIAGNQAPMGKIIEWKMPYSLVTDELRERALKRLEHRYFLALNTGYYHFLVSDLRNKVVVSELQHSIPVTLKPKLDIPLLYEIISSEGVLLEVPLTGIKKVTSRKTRVIV